MIQVAYIRLARVMGGVTSYLFTLMRHLPPDSFFTIALLRDPRAIEQAKIRGLPCHRLEKKGKLDPRLLWRLPSYLKLHPVDILHSQGMLSDFLSARAKIRGAVGRQVITLHTLPESDSTLGRWKLSIYRAMNRFSWRTADRIVVVFQGRRDELVNLGVNPEKIRVIYNGIDPGPFRGAREAGLRESIGAGPEETLIGSVGRLVEEKGHRFLLRAFAALREKCPRNRLLLAGSGNQMGQLQKLARELGVRDKINFLGERRDIPRVLAALDIFVLPSLTEALPISLLEAMAAGRPTIASRVGGIPEIVREGVNGLLVPPADPPGLADAIEALIGDRGRARRIGEAGQRTVEKNFTADQMAYATGAVYHELIPEKR